MNHALSLIKNKRFLRRFLCLQGILGDRPIFSCSQIQIIWRQLLPFLRCFFIQDLTVASPPLLKRDKAESAAIGLGRGAGFRKMALTCPLAKSGTAMASRGLRAACITFTVQSASAVLGPADPSSSLHFRCRLLRCTIWSAGSESKRFGTLVQRS